MGASTSACSKQSQHRHGVGQHAGQPVVGYHSARGCNIPFALQRNSLLLRLGCAQLLASAHPPSAAAKLLLLLLLMCAMPAHAPAPPARTLRLLGSQLKPCNTCSPGTACCAACKAALTPAASAHLALHQVVVQVVQDASTECGSLASARLGLLNHVQVLGERDDAFLLDGGRLLKTWSVHTAASQALCSTNTRRTKRQVAAAGCTCLALTIRVDAAQQVLMQPHLIEGV